jgi:lysophospholipid acyltransferase (LPLAT)-like uncharacterized protein
VIKELTSNAFQYSGYFLFKLLYLSCRIKYLDEHGKQIPIPQSLDSSCLVSVWHEQVVLIVLTQKGIPFRPMISRSSHGRFIGYICSKFGYFPLYGSENRNGKDKGGASALFGALKALKKGKPVALTVDGSTGPRRYVKQGIIDLARKTQSPIVPVACYSDSFWELNTWDRLKIPKPFSSITVKYGAAINISKDTEKEAFEGIQAQLGNNMDSLEWDIKHG